MKKLIAFLLVMVVLALCGCSNSTNYDIVATTLPVYDFVSAICADTGLKVGRLVTESVSCLHDYTLQVDQMQMIENANVVVISGAGLEDFLEDALVGANSVIDASVGVHIHNADHDHPEDHGHNHEADPHIWLSTENAEIMAQNIAAGLMECYPEYEDLIKANLNNLSDAFDELQQYGNRELSVLSCRDMITFHDGFSYFAESFDLHILEAVEEEAGSEASAAEIIHLIEVVNANALPAVFTERNGSDASAGIISRETSINIYTLDMAMAGDSYFDAMYHNINTVKEALG